MTTSRSFFVIPAITARHLYIATASLCMLALSGNAVAYTQDFGNDLALTVDGRATFGATWRMETPDKDLIGQANGGNGFSTNGDEAQDAYDKAGRLAFLVFKLTTDMNLSWQDFGVFLRGTYRYDPVNNRKDFFDDNDHGGAASGDSQTEDDLDSKRDQIRDEIGSNGQLLDAYVYGTFDILGKDLNFRVGRQTLNWGESTFIPNGINSVDSANLNNLRVPGFELIEVFIPSAMAWVAMDVIEDLSVEAFYQWRWERTDIDAAGSYFSSNDFVGIGGNNAEIGFGRCPENSLPGTCAFAAGGSAIPRGPDIEPEDGGQYGAAIRYFSERLNNTEFALYYANYHSRLPVASGNAVIFPGVPGSGRYVIEYPEDIQLYGISFNTNLPWGGIALQGEYSYKQDQPLAIDEVELFLAGLRVGQPSQIGTFGPGQFIQGWQPFDVSQFTISGTKIFGPMPRIRSDQLLLLLETSVSHVHDMPSENELRLEGPGTYRPANPAVAAATGVPQQTDGYADETSWGYRLLARLTYNSVFGVVNLEPTLFFSHDFSGTSPSPVLNFVEDRKQLTVGLTGVYRGAWEGGLGYTYYWGGEPFNLISDRDALNLYMAYSF